MQNVFLFNRCREAEALDKLHEEENGLIAEARNILESLKGIGADGSISSLASLKTLKEVERERSKCTKAKRKLKVQVSSS